MKLALMKKLKYFNFSPIWLVLFSVNIYSLSACNMFYDFHKSQSKKAIEIFSKAIEKDPKSAYNYDGLGYAYSSLAIYEKEQFAKAIENYSKAIELDPKYSEAYRHRADAYVEIREYQKAINDCSKAIALNPRDASAYHIRSKGYTGIGEDDLAEKDEKEFWRLAKNSQKPK
jgi:tetratricopeptide (TPR) repeat protein